MISEHRTTTHTAPYLIIDSGSETDGFLSPVVEGSNPFLSSADIDLDVSRDGGYPSLAGQSRTAESTRPSMPRSMSDVIPQTQSETSAPRGSVSKRTLQSQKVDNQHQAKPQSRSQGSLQALRPSALRSCSSSRVELRSRYHDPSITSPTLQRELIVRTRLAGKRPLFVQQVRHAGQVSVPSKQQASENTEPTLRWYGDLSARSSPDLRRDFNLPKKHGQELPLKTCLKTKAQSTTTTPPSEVSEVTDISSTRRTLRRVKTVDFAEVTKPLLVPSTLKATRVTEAEDDPKVSTGIHAPQSKKTPGYPGPMYTGKCGLANPATTRTDVHVIAIAPSRTVDKKDKKDSIDPATPTMQIVESSNGCYEVIWDDVPDEHNIQTHRRSSSACHSLQAVSSTAVRGLQHVNFKLTDWSESWNAPSDTFKPTIVVFPDDDGRMSLTCATDDDEDLHLLVPPNSQRTSAGPSRLPSRPASAPTTRAASEEEIEIEEALQHSLPPSQHSWTTHRVVPDSEVQPTRFFSPDRRMYHTTAARNFSNLEDTDIKFRGHRDSVTLARSRLLHSSDFPEVMFPQGDSLSMTKRRMHAWNHATSTARTY